ncbi:hypothetical protein DFH07DRAFT_772123 [Mycena maculata]|uniref:Ubiquitin-like protease family profile domain-containing protein n=1 Tax=Mycena maculata TaxID=230809 RepID=A0AAD7JCN7_9AGAR|nr:hypothetical protein DFH07DRAFT_772123 [Mycena maculata]
MASFDKAQWVSCGKLWKDIPKSVRQISQYDFKIPDAIAAKILPDAGISIHAVLDFTLPRPTSTARDMPNTLEFFSKYDPDTLDAAMIRRLRHLDMPPVATIRQLVQEGSQAWLDGFTSVKYSHISGEVSTHFPLWVISFWNAVIDIRLHVRKPWTDARDWVKKQMENRKNPSVRKQGTDVTKLLGILPCSPLHTLWRYPGTEWLSSSDINDALELLRGRVAADAELAGSVRVEAVEFTAKITDAFKGREKFDYEESVGMRWLRSLGNDIFGHGERLVTIAHLGAHNKKKHWVAIEVDGQRRVVRYGDSLGDDIPPTLRQAYEWWMSHHTVDPVQFGSLPTSMQTDGHSCGPMAINCAERCVFPEIPSMEQGDVPLARLRMLSTLSNRVLDRIADEETEEAEEDQQSDSEHGTPEPQILPKIFPPPAAFTNLARSAAFTFDSPRTDPTNLKRAKGHPDGPTPTSSPEKKRVRAVSRERSPPPPLQFDPPEASTLLEHAKRDHASSASVPTDVFGSIQAPTQAASRQQSKIGSFFYVGTAEEKAQMHARNWEKMSNSRDVREALEEQEKYQSKLNATAKATERKQRSRAKQRAEKVAAGWEPQKCGRKRKLVELEDVDQGSSASSSKLAEDSRPRRQFQEDSRKDNKPQGRKRLPQNKPIDAEKVNWQNPLLWSQIELAALKSGSGLSGWSPSEIVRQARLMAPETFRTLTSQVVGRWIDKDAKARGVDKWLDSVLEKVPSGAAPGGQSTRAGILASGILFRITYNTDADPRTRTPRCVQKFNAISRRFGRWEPLYPS